MFISFLLLRGFSGSRTTPIRQIQEVLNHWVIRELDICLRGDLNEVRVLPVLRIVEIIRELFALGG